MNTHLLSTLICRWQAQGGKVIFFAQCCVVSRDGSDIRSRLTTISELIVSRQRQHWWNVYQSPYVVPCKIYSVQSAVESSGLRLAYCFGWFCLKETSEWQATWRTFLWSWTHVVKKKENDSNFNSFSPLETNSWVYVFADYSGLLYFIARAFIHLSQICCLIFLFKRQKWLRVLGWVFKGIGFSCFVCSGSISHTFFSFLSSPFLPSHQRRLKSSFPIWRLKLENKIICRANRLKSPLWIFFKVSGMGSW